MFFLFSFCFSDKNKLDDIPQNEKSSKNGQSGNIEVENFEKDRSVMSNSEKTKENDENKDVKEINDDKLRTYILNINVIMFKTSFFFNVL